jgi:hypothetical protein
MSAPVLRRVTVTFADEGDLEIAVAYTHTDCALPTPGSKSRTTKALRMARAGLETALDSLGSGSSAGAGIWGGFATDTRESTDHVIVEREPRDDKERAA